MSTFVTFIVVPMHIIAFFYNSLDAYPTLKISKRVQVYLLQYVNIPKYCRAQLSRKTWLNTLVNSESIRFSLHLMTKVA